MTKKVLMLGSQIHGRQKGIGADTFSCNHFIRRYAAHDKMRGAMNVFTEVALPEEFMWSSMISAHAKQEQAR